MRQVAMAAMGVMVAGPALAHVGHEGTGFFAGTAHPFLGLDHLLAMMAVGMLVVRERMAWPLPATFLAAMALGMALGVAGVTLPGLEATIAVSVVGLGGALVLGPRLRLDAIMGAVALFGLLHGLAHGAEAGGGLPVLTGMLAGTAALHAIGLGAGLSLRGAALRTSGAVVAAAGLALLVV